VQLLAQPLTFCKQLMHLALGGFECFLRFSCILRSPVYCGLEGGNSILKLPHSRVCRGFRLLMKLRLLRCLIASRFLLVHRCPQFIQGSLQAFRQLFLLLELAEQGLSFAAQSPKLGLQPAVASIWLELPRG
jgi:hypothetical protein